MSARIDSLHKILKDNTRRNIILTLNEEGAVTYTDLMSKLSVTRTGTLNYHLKVLGDLIAKNDAGQYTLTEKGKVAVQLLQQFPQIDTQLETKKVWWRRFWVAAILLQTGGLLVFAFMFLLGRIDVFWLTRGVIGFVFGVTFLFFFYRMIRPPTPKPSGSLDQTRTTRDIYVQGRTPEEVTAEVKAWVQAKRISLEEERVGYLRGRMGIPSGLGWTAPKYFEVTLKPNGAGVNVRTEGWISVFDVSERSFSNKRLVYGNIPRRQGWKAISNLWDRLNSMSRS